MNSNNFTKRAKAWLDRKYRWVQKQYYKEKFMQVIFSEIWQKNTWSGDESVSGPGSSLAQTKEIRHRLPDLLKKFHVKSLLDIPCGDFYWMNQTDTSSLKKYIGADIIQQIIKEDKKRYKKKNFSFIRLDLTKDTLPQVDMILVRDCLVHLSFEDIFSALRNIKKSKSTYLLATTFPHTTHNEDIITGYWRAIDLQKSPFNFPKPMYLLNEKCTEMGGKYKNKSLGLWMINEIELPNG